MAHLRRLPLWIAKRSDAALSQLLPHVLRVRLLEATAAAQGLCCLFQN